MDHVGTFEMAEKLNEFNMLTALHRFYSQNEFEKKIACFKKKDPTLAFFKNIMVTTGMQESSNSIISSAAAILSAIGFSTRTCLPRRVSPVEKY